MRFKVGVIRGASKLKDQLLDIATGYEHSYKQHLAEGAMLVRNAAVKGIRTQSMGELQTRYSPRRIVRVSKAQDAPNTDLGTLIKSIGWNVDEVNGIAEVGTNLKYGKYLELGTQDIAARPWLYPALESVKPKLMKIFRKGRGRRAIGGD